jgi:hypothetical protein
VTAAAPGHLTNMLRVIASPSDAADDEPEDDDAQQAHTKVMLNAPVKPPPHHSRRGGIPDSPSSDSGLLVAAQHHPGDLRGPMASDPGLGGSPSDRIPRSPFGPAPMPMREDDRKPPYALVVGVVAAISILIPVLLFIFLSQGGGDPPPRVLSQPSPDPVGLTGARPRAKPGPSTTPPVRPNNGSGVGGGGPTNRGPFRR